MVSSTESEWLAYSKSAFRVYSGRGLGVSVGGGGLKGVSVGGEKNVGVDDTVGVSEGIGVFDGTGPSVGGGMEMVVGI
jgi:hypothetical protein